MTIYRTSQGETWDSIAKKLFGDEYACEALMTANMGLVGQGYVVFPAGLELGVPEVDARSTQAVPPWRKTR